MYRSLLLVLLVPLALLAKEKKADRPPTSPANCYRCHVPHVSETGPLRPLRNPGPEVCMSCHDGVIAMPFGPDDFGHKFDESFEVRATCTTCHDPHATHAQKL